MNFRNLQIRNFPKTTKWLIGLFVIVMSYGYLAGIRFVEHTTNITPAGIEESYLGNEGLDDEEIEVMKYEKTKQEMLTMFHTHVMSLAMVFFLTGSLVLMTGFNRKFKKTVALEPLISVLVTFGGIYWMWNGWYWLKYIVFISGVLMTLSYVIGVILILLDLLKKPLIEENTGI